METNCLILLKMITEETANEIIKMNINNVFTPNNLKITSIYKYKPDYPNYKYKNQTILKGIVSTGIDEVEFEIRTGSQLCLIKTGHSVSRQSTEKVLTKMFGKLTDYKPDERKEYNFIWDVAKEQDFTFVHGNSLIFDCNVDLPEDEWEEYDLGDLHELYKENKLPKGYKLYFADLILDDEYETGIDYYRNVIQISSMYNQFSDWIFDTFEHYMT